jgi:hypothetical protein
MAKQRSTQSSGSGEAGAETTTGQGLERFLEPLMLVLHDEVLDAVGAGSDALGRILSTGGFGPEQVSALVDAEDVLDRIARALEPACEVVSLVSN